jgi:RNA polymerase sigma-70 factor (ECF subfamily)
MLQIDTKPYAPGERALEDEDLGLVHAAKAGDADAFEHLLRKHQASVFRIAQHITRSREDAEEVSQESFLKAFQNLDRFEERSRFSTWLTRIVVNTALMRVRTRRGPDAVFVRQDDPADATPAPQEEVVDWRPNPEQLYGRQELRDILSRALASLPQIYGTVFVLRDVEGFSTTETAEALELSETAVKARLLRARLQLRAKLTPYFRRGEARKASNGSG